MSATPQWLLPTTAPTTREFLEGRYQIAWPRILDSVTGGCTLKAALDDYPIQFDQGRFIRWINRDAQRRREYEEAKEFRSEVWAGRALAHAEGSANQLEDVARSKLVVDTYKWLMGADNRQTYGQQSKVEVSHTVSILQALEDSQKRLEALPLLHSTALETTPEIDTDAPEILLDAPPDPENDDDAC